MDGGAPYGGPDHCAKVADLPTVLGLGRDTGPVGAGPQPGAPDPERVLSVKLRVIDVDVLLAMAEWALGQRGLDLGPGLYRRHAVAAIDRLEAGLPSG